MVINYTLQQFFVINKIISHYIHLRKKAGYITEHNIRRKVMSSLPSDTVVTVTTVQ